MKFLRTFTDYKNLIKEEYNVSLLLVNLTLGKVDKQQITATYSILYDNKEITKGNTILKIVNDGNINAYVVKFTLNNPQYPITGTFDIHVAIKDAKQGVVLPVKYLNSNANMTGIYNIELKSKNENAPILEDFNLNFGNFFAPNVDTIDETKKGDLNTQLAQLNDYFNKNKAYLTKPNACVVTFIGGASLVTTSYQGGNQKLAENRAINLKKYISEYFKTTNPDLSKFITNASDITTVIGKTPYVQGTDNANDEKYTKEQFVNFTIKINK